MVGRNFCAYVYGSGQNSGLIQGVRIDDQDVLSYTYDRNNPENVVRHEYGHTRQLLQLGVMKYAIDIGIPSAFEIGGGSYYDRPWEITADVYGGVQSRYHSNEDIEAGFSYLKRSMFNGSFVWVFME